MECYESRQLVFLGGVSLSTLSLTSPSLQAVQQVVTNLQIGHIELRNEDSEDIQRYVHERKVEKIIVPLEGEIADVKNSFLKVRVTENILSNLLDLFQHTLGEVGQLVL